MSKKEEKVWSDRVGGCACDRVIAGLIQPTKTVEMFQKPPTAIQYKNKIWRATENGIFYSFLYRICNHG